MWFESSSIVASIRGRSQGDDCNGLYEVSHVGNAVQVIPYLSKLQIHAPTRSEPFQIPQEEEGGASLMLIN